MFVTKKKGGEVQYATTKFDQRCALVAPSVLERETRFKRGAKDARHLRDHDLRPRKLLTISWQHTAPHSSCYLLPLTHLSLHRTTGTGHPFNFFFIAWKRARIKYGSLVITPANRRFPVQKECLYFLQTGTAETNSHVCNRCFSRFSSSYLLGAAGSTSCAIFLGISHGCTTILSGASPIL